MWRHQQQAHPEENVSFTMKVVKRFLKSFEREVKSSHERKRFWIHPLLITKSYPTFIARLGLIILKPQMNPQSMLRENLVSSFSWSLS